MPTTRSRAPSAARSGSDHAVLAQLGGTLREAREARGEDLHDIAAYLRIKPEYLAALEAGDPGATPGAVYASGFLRSYADCLALDGTAMAAALKRASAPGGPVAPGAAAPPRDARFPGGATTAASLLLLAAMVAGYRHLGWHDVAGPAAIVALEPPPTAPAPPPTPAADAASAVAAEPLPILASIEGEPPAAPSAEGAAGGRVTLLARASSWVQLRSADGSFVRSRTLDAGERMVVPPRRDLALSTGDAGGLEVLVDGRTVGPLGAAGGVVRDLPLAPEALLARRAVGG